MHGGTRYTVMSWTIPKLRPGYRIEFGSAPTAFDVSLFDPHLVLGFEDGHVVLFDASQGKVAT